MADNAGYDSADLVSKLRAAHYEGRSDAGLGPFFFPFSPFLPPPPKKNIVDTYLDFDWVLPDMNLGEIGSMRKLGITESYKLKRQVVSSASEAAEMILRVDNIVRAAPRFVYFYFLFSFSFLDRSVAD